MPRRFVFIATAGFAIGLIGGNYLPIFFPLTGLLSAVIISSWTRRWFGLVVFLALVTIGVGRIQQVLQTNETKADQLTGIDQPLSGLVTRAAIQYGRQSLELSDLRSGDRPLHSGGRATSFDILPVTAGDVVMITCRWTGFKADQRRRLAAQGLHAECRQPDQLMVHGRGTTWRAWLARTRGQLVARVQDQYHHPQSDLLAGVLLGVQETMSVDLREDFRATGTSHIVALSGFNVTIIITILAGTLTSLIGRRLAWWPTAGLIVAFVVMTGASASVTRAAVMAIVVMLGQQAGRPIAPSRFIAYTFVAMTAANPLILVYDLGFQLSFFATVGLIYISPGVATRLGRVPEVLGLRSNLASTLAAMAATEPLLLWLFGRVSIVAPLVNVIVLPCIPLIMATGAIALVFPFAVPITDVLLRFVLWVITTAGSWSGAQLGTPWWAAGTIAAIAAIVSLRMIYEHQTKNVVR